MKMRKQTLSAKLSDEDTFATSLLAIAVDTYGTDIFDWDPQTLNTNLEEDFSATLPVVNRDKLQSLILAYTSDMFYVSVEAFTHICNVLSGAEANFSRWDMLTSEEIIWGIYEVSLNVAIDREAGDDPPEFGHEVRRYIGTVLEADGVTEPPDILRIAEMSPSTKADEWSDDPTFFNAAFDKAKTESRELLMHLASRLSQLMEEMNSLPLQHRDAEAWKKFKTAVERFVPKLVEDIAAS